MIRLCALVFSLLSFLNAHIYSQINVRLFANRLPESAVFSVTGGRYDVMCFNGEHITVTEGEQVIVMKIMGRLALKARNAEGYIVDSVYFTGLTGNDSFSLRINGPVPLRQYYTGDLFCFPDLETLVLINNCHIDDYISGVVKAEGGSGHNEEYFKTQAVIARTYMYRYLDKHMTDRYSVCDNTHCQAFNGTCSDTLIHKAALETKGLVITGRDSSLIISAFHSNCGGETVSSEDVWLSKEPYLKSVKDPYCVSSRNALWEKRMSLGDWVSVLQKSGYKGITGDPAVFKFDQKFRMNEYMAGSFTMPLNILRTELSLRSTFFSVIPGKDYVILRGKGYGHGVGLCQEGAMVMASKGFTFREIIDFYYSGVIIMDVKNAVNLPVLTGRPGLLNN